MFVSILRVISSTNAGANLAYLIDEKAHDTSLTSHRNLAFGGQNVFSDWNGNVNSRYLADQFWAVRQRAKNSNKRVQAEHLIFSFSADEFSPDKSTLSTEIDQMKQLVKSFMVAHFPKTAQYFLAFQADSKGQNLHCHATVNSVLTDGRVLNTNTVSVTGKDNIRDAFDQHLEKNFKKVTGRDWEPVKPQSDSLVSSKTVKVDERGGYVWKEDLKDRIADAFNNTDNLEDFKAVLEANNGVEVSVGRASVGKDKNGKKIYRPAYSYHFTDSEGHKRTSRDFYYYRGGQRGLGLSYTPDGLSKAFKKRSKEQEAIDQTEDQTPVQDTPEPNNDTSKSIELQQVINQLNEENEEEQDNGNQSEEPVNGTVNVDEIEFAQTDTTGAEEQLNNQQERLKRKLNQQRQRNQRQRQQRVESEQASSEQSNNVAEQPKHDDGRTKADRAKSSKSEPVKQESPEERPKVQSASSEPDDGPDW